MHRTFDHPIHTDQIRHSFRPCGTKNRGCTICNCNSFYNIYNRFYYPDRSRIRRPLARKVERVAWVKPVTVLMSPLSSGPEFTGAQEDREASAAMRWCLEPVKLPLLLSGPQFVAAMAVRVKVKSAAMKWSLEPGQGRRDQGCQMSALGVVVGSQARKACALGSVRMLVLGSVAVAT
jgi:hypothetical protein